MDNSFLLCTLCSAVVYMDVNYDYMPETLATSEKQRSSFAKRKICLRKKQEAVGSNKVALPHGGYKSKIIRQLIIVERQL